MDDLAPCRCGCDKQTIRTADFQPNGKGTKYSVICEQCGIKASAYNDRDAAKRAWNEMQDVADTTNEVFGFYPHRLDREDSYYEKEVRLHDTFNLWIKRNPRFWDFMLGIDERGQRPTDYLSNRELKLVATVTQWLGTPVGQDFLKEAGILE